MIGKVFSGKFSVEAKGAVSARDEEELAASSQLTDVSGDGSDAKRESI